MSASIQENSLYVRGGGSQDFYRVFKVNDQITLKEGKVLIRTRRPLKILVHKNTTKLGWLAWLAWLTRVFVKCTILLLVLFGLGMGMYSTISHSKATNMLNSIELASEKQIGELQGFVKETSRMLQVQLELLDMKYAKEVDSMKKELEKKIQEHTSELVDGLDNLKTLTNGMEETLKQLKDGGILSRNDVKEIVNEMSKTRAVTGEGQALSLDDVRTAAKQLINEELERHSADGLGMVDFAVKSGGGKVVRHSEGYNYGPNFRCGLCTFFHRTGALHPCASKMLEPSFGEPGKCLPLKGSKVFVDIALQTSIFVSAVTLEHVQKSVAYERSSAPKDFRIFRWLSQPKKNQNTEEAHQMFLLGEFTYDLDKKNVQTFHSSFTIKWKACKHDKIGSTIKSWKSFTYLYLSAEGASITASRKTNIDRITDAQGYLTNVAKDQSCECVIQHLERFLTFSRGTLGKVFDFQQRDTV